MNENNPDNERIFEDEVRKIARNLWPQAEFQGSAILSGRERDGVFITEECIHLIEATTSRSKAKAEQDLKKLNRLAIEFRKTNGTKAVQCWFITQSEPTADQRGVQTKLKEKANILSFDQFRSKIVDASAYLNLRQNFRFGSVRDPITGNFNPNVEYIKLDLIDRMGNNYWSINNISDGLLTGKRFVILGDFGAGKSMTLREVYIELRKRYLKHKTTIFPIYINMRDHFGQTDPTEILERHARQIGFGNPTHLVRAWRSGYSILIIDGFDEVTSLGLQGAWRKLRDTRYQSMQAIRTFIRDSTSSTGIVLAGRPQFFDNDEERNTALDLSHKFECLSLNEFTDMQIKDFLKKSKLYGNVPLWMPGRPLLVAYLVARGLIGKNEGIDSFGREEGWHHLLEKISEREAEIEAGIDGATVRRILERLSTKARSSNDGLGPLSPEQVIEAFEEICGYAPDAEAMVLLQRLPGLGIDSTNPENRLFVDIDFADTCRAGDVVRCIENPYDFSLSLFDKGECCLDELGVAIAAIRLPRDSFQEGKIIGAIKYLHNHEADRTINTDIIRVAAARGDIIKDSIYIKDVVLNEWDLGAITGNISKVTFQESYVGKLELDEEIESNILPKFNACFIGKIEGRTDLKDLPEGIFDSECVFDSFMEKIDTTNGILELTLPLGTKVLLTILKKLYIQRGRGRRENALLRGLDQRSQRVVPEILSLLEKEQLSICRNIDGKRIWYPDRSFMSRVGKMLAAPHESKDPILKSASLLS